MFRPASERRLQALSVLSTTLARYESRELQAALTVLTDFAQSKSSAALTQSGCAALQWLRSTGLIERHPELGPAINALRCELIPEPLEAGKRFGPFEVSEELGRGGGGVVYLAREIESGQLVALKRALLEPSPQKAASQALLEEALVARRIDDPWAVAVYGVFEDSESNPVIVSEVLDGGDLRAWLRSLQDCPGLPSLSPRARWLIAEQLARGLAAAHRANIIHQDIKAENFLVNQRISGPVAEALRENEPDRAELLLEDARDIPWIKLSDWGLSLLREASSQTDGHSQTFSNSRIPEHKRGGTLVYMAPEQVGGEGLSRGTDIFALGLVFYELLTDQHAQSARELAEGFEEHHWLDSTSYAARVFASTAPSSIDSQRDLALRHLSSIARDLLAQMTARERRARPNIDEVLQNLDDFISARAPSPAPRWSAVLISIVASLALSSAALLSVIPSETISPPKSSEKPAASLPKSLKFSEDGIPVILEKMANWSGASAEEREMAAERVGAIIGAEFRLLGIERFSCADLAHELAVFLHEASGIELILLPGDEFSMGTADLERELSFCQRFDQLTNKKSLEGEQPFHRARCEPMLMGRFEISRAQWARIRGEPEQSSLPQAMISWIDAQNWLKAAGSGLRLPSEVEWEYACRAGSTTRYFWGDDFDSRYADADQAKDALLSAIDSRRDAPNAFGLSDMAGKVWEWCADEVAIYPSELQLPRPRGDPEDLNPKILRIERGGAATYSRRHARSAERSIDEADKSYPSVGFRVARSLRPYAQVQIFNNPSPLKISSGGAKQLPPILESLTSWQSALSEEKEAALAATLRYLGENYENRGLHDFSCKGLSHRFGVLRHRRTGIDFVVIPGGEFWMGDDSQALEKPAHKVLIRAFLIATRELTENQWNSGLGASASPTGDIPKGSLSFNDCLGWLEGVGEGLRLPSEAEWEYAARGASSDATFWPKGQETNYVLAAGLDSAPVRASNAFGLIDGCGSLWEWVADEFLPYQPETRSSLLRGDPRAPLRVLRGGGSDSPLKDCRATRRTSAGRDKRTPSCGMRVARSL